MKTLILLALLAVSACASPEPSYFRLAPIRGASQGGGPALVELRRPGIAGYLDRSEIVRAKSPYQLRVTGGERWGEPFGDMVARVLAEDLSSRLPGTSVFTSTGAISVDPEATIEIDVQRFDADLTGQVQFLAQVAVSRRRSRANASARAVRASVTPAGPTTADYVAAMSTALGQAADQIARMLRGR
jgi:uncharacterized lipoprotein YmbA